VSGEFCASLGFQAAVDFVGDGFYEGQVGMQAGLDFEGFSVGLAFAEIEELVEWGGVGGGEFGGGGDGFAFGGGDFFAEGEDGVAEEGAKSREGIRHQGEVGFFGERGGDDGLAEAKPVGAELALDLEAMEMERDFEIGEEVGAEENAVAGFHVEEFDSEDVGGAGEFVASEDERRMVAPFNPPFGDAVEGLEIFGVGVIDEAEDVEVGLAGAEFAGGGGAVEDDGDEVGACGGLEAVEEFFELGFHD
jgi:hypothetical protein